MKLIYALLCDHAFLSIDRKVNIIGVFETINAPSFPVNHAKFTLVGSIASTEDNFKLAVDIVSEKTKQSILQTPQEREVKLPNNQEKRNFNFIIEIINTTFPQEGNYIVEVKINDKLISGQNLILAKTEDLSNYS